MAGRQYAISIDLAPERLLYAGPLIPGAWRHPRDKEEAGSVGGEILINTGAFGAMIDVEAADRLRLPIRGTKEIHGIHGSVLFPAIKRSLFFLLRIRTEETANSQKLLNA